MNLPRITDTMDLPEHPPFELKVRMLMVFVAMMEMEAPPQPATQEAAEIRHEIDTRAVLADIMARARRANEPTTR